MINGFDSLIVTKLDVLDEFEQIKVCVGYRIGGQEICDMPPTVTEIEKVEAVYECLPGWNSSTFGIDSYDDCRRGRRTTSRSWRSGRAWRSAASRPDRSGIRRSCARARGSKS